jgi:hypothetical protein
MSNNIASMLFLLTLAAPSAACATVSCPDPPVDEAFRTSKVVVAATATAVSLREMENGDTRQTVLWTAHETWQGPHYKGSTFTTRGPLLFPLRSGDSMLLYLNGSEPYEIDTWCNRSKRLDEALPEVHKLYEIFWQIRQLPPNNSFKPTPLRGAA